MVAQEARGANMSTALEPVTRERLYQFRRRQQWLQAAKGVGLGLALALTVLAMVVLIDAGIVVNQAARWCLSLAIYGTLLGWLGATAVRVARRVPLPATARHFEELDPRLHEQLLAAVELSEDVDADEKSSAGFRAKLQRQVAHAVAPVRMDDLLPWSMISRFVLPALVGLSLCIGLTFVPGMHWSHRVARALLPGANLGRITRFQIEVISPKPASTIMPAGDVAAIEALVLGPVPDTVLLEIRAAGASETMAMRRVTRLVPQQYAAQPINESSATAIQIDPSDMVYTANLQLNNQDVEYRVLVEDAHTAWFRLTTKGRPQVEKFKKTILYPSYSRLADKEISETGGDVEALKGSRVRLEITCDQAVRHAALRDARVPLAEIHGATQDVRPMRPSNC